MRNKIFISFLSASLLLLIIGCKEKNNEARYTIAGTIKNAGNQQLLLQQLFAREAVDVLDAPKIAVGHQLIDHHFAQSIDVGSAARGEMQDLRSQLSRADVHATAVVDGFALFSHDGRAAGRTQLGHAKCLGPPAVFTRNRTDDLRNHIAGSSHKHLRANADFLTPHFEEIM